MTGCYSISCPWRQYIPGNEKTHRPQTPHQIWSCQNYDVIFMYSERCLDGCMRLFYIPHKSMVYIDMNIDYCIHKITCEIEIIHKCIKITGIICMTRFDIDFENEARTNIGGLDLFEQSLVYFRDEYILEKLKSQMFGEEYDLLISTNVKTLDIEKLIQSQKWHDTMYYENGPWGRCIATFDTKRYDAATLIQSVFRGWRARMKYRYNPHTRLGQYVIGKMFRD